MKRITLIFVALGIGTTIGACSGSPAQESDGVASASAASRGGGGHSDPCLYNDLTCDACLADTANDCGYFVTSDGPFCANKTQDYWLTSVTSCSEVDGGAGSSSGGGSSSGSSSGGGMSTPTTDPFDPNSCTGTPLDLDHAELMAYSALGTIASDPIGAYTIVEHHRLCTSETGCTSWSANDDNYFQPGGDGAGPINDANQSASLAFWLTSQGYSQSTFGVSLFPGVTEAGWPEGPVPQTSCVVTNGVLSCGQYYYFVGPGTVGAEWLASGPPTCIDAEDCWATNIGFSGVLTDHCLRLVAQDAADDQEFGILIDF